MTVQISIIVPTLNEADTITHCLIHLQNQQDVKYEVIVVDGGSQDNTLELAHQLADRALTGQRGRAQQMNLGAQHASGPILLFLHSDTILPHGGLKILIDQLASHPSSLWGRFDVHIHGQSKGLTMVAYAMNLRSRLTGIATGDQAIFVRRATFEMIGGFPEQPLMEDIALCSKLRAYSKPLCLNLKVQTSGRRWDKYGLWRTIFLMSSLRLMYFLGVPAHKLAKKYGYS